MLLKKVSILGGEIYNMSKSFAHHIPAKPGSDLIRTVLLWYTHKVCKIPLVIRISWQTADYNNTHTHVYKYINRNYQHLFNFSKKTFFIYQTILTQTMRQKDIQIKLDTHTHAWQNWSDLFPVSSHSQSIELWLIAFPCLVFSSR